MEEPTSGESAAAEPKSVASEHKQQDVCTETDQNRVHNQQDVRKGHGHGGGGLNRHMFHKKNRKRYAARQQKNNRKNWKLIKMNRKKEKSLLQNASKDPTEIGVGGQQQQQPAQQLNAQTGRKHGHHSYHDHRNYLNQKFNKNLHNKRVQSFSISKFFLPDKRPRKDCIVPPTKFLFGGNISDPLNLNSLQNESENAITPKSSPIPTPPHYKAKVEVIIPPNIYDPLHLMDPVDSVEYEMQLCSPLKRQKNKHRNRKKRKQQQNSSSATDAGNVSSNVESDGEPAAGSTASTVTTNFNKDEIQRRLLEREKVVKAMKLDLDNPRKRRVSETSTSCAAYKLRRMESLDKIVSPVIPQPGGWKRPLYNLPRGERKRSRTHSQSVVDELISPREADKTKEFADLIKTAATAEGGQPEQPVGEPVASVSDTDKEVVESKGEAKAKDEKEKVHKFGGGGLDATYQYGNYDRYYGYRNLNENIDVRFKVFTRNAFLFKDKDILDIGCNVGLMSIAVAKHLQPRSVVGIDIDKNLIARARKNLALYVRVPPPSPPQPVGTVSPVPSTSKAAQQPLVTQELSTEKSTQTEKERKQRPRHQQQHHQQQGRQRQAKKTAEFFPVSFPINFGPIPSVEHFEVGKDERDEDERFLFPKNVIFKTANYVLKDEALLNCESQQYDLILCLSTTKWIHLNFGDAGLKLAFKRMFNQLRPGGKLILEAQNWASYKKKKKITETVYNNFKTIEFFPNKFHEYLLSPEVGFSHTYPLGIPRHLSKGFRRPIQLYVKGDFTPSKAQWSDTYLPSTPYITHTIYADPMRGSRKYTDLWGGHTPSFTPSHGQLLPTSPYYDPRNTDSYLPSYETEIQGRSYLFASPQYSTTVWSPPSDGGGSRRSSSTRNASIRSVDGNDDGTRRKHIYPPMAIDGKFADQEDHDTRQSGGSSGGGSGHNSVRIPDEFEESQQHVYINSTTSPAMNGVAEEVPANGSATPEFANDSNE